MQFKYQDLGEGIIKLLKQRKQNGENIMVIRATEVKRLLDVQKICGACRNGRYAMICQAMKYASDRIPAKQIDGNYESSNYTLEYQLNLF